MWIYFTEGVVRAWSDRPPGSTLALFEAMLCVSLFTACALHVRLRSNRAANTGSFVNTVKHPAGPQRATTNSSPTLLDEFRGIVGAQHVLTHDDASLDRSAFAPQPRRRPA